ncbi:hypothetical protein PKB_4209 [Pseudomonas knackmussii B13]|uniref:Uncharacterized protein n=1 Tax=Pseudomonas knackmussii (strain DSM 6978 / CCUG 54928 / LMG 23759 / B13) TaxID=1301098 RepID=A0A024HLP1_PSEKB|nr:hypothetical protein PKB_4209 [Pseudomonas knackmussii B13]
MPAIRGHGPLLQGDTLPGRLRMNPLLQSRTRGGGSGAANRPGGAQRLASVVARPRLGALATVQLAPARYCELLSQFCCG